MKPFGIVYLIAKVLVLALNWIVDQVQRRKGRSRLQNTNPRSYSHLQDLDRLLAWFARFPYEQDITPDMILNDLHESS